MKSPFSQWLLIAAALLASVSAEGQPNAREAMLEGNALFRAGLYRAALLRYREAASAGPVTPLLSYNLGVTYYRLGEPETAEGYLEAATADAAIAPLAAYNLGAIRRASGDSAGAAAEFRRAASLASDRGLRRAAERAAEAAENSNAAGVSRAPAAAARSARRPAADERPGTFRLVTLARVGQDDNVYRAPAEPYVDRSDPTLPTVIPVVHSSTYMPVDVLAEYALSNEAGDTDFIFGYRLDGDFYPTEFANADRVSQRFSVGADIVLSENERRRRTLDSAFFLRTHDEKNFDPDDGVDRTLDGEDLSDRYRYRAAGAEAAYGHEIGPWTWGFEMTFERRQYKETPLVRSYDQEVYFTELGFGRAFGNATRVSVAFRQYRRIYDERLSRDLTGALLLTNPPLELDYLGIGLGIEHDVSRSLELAFDLQRLERTDAFEGYYDYSQNLARIGASFRPNARFELAAGLTARVYDYPNAFAFNDPAAGPRELDTLGWDLRIEYRMTRGLSLWASLDSDEVSSTDPRSEYAQAQSTLGVLWRRR